MLETITAKALGQEAITREEALHVAKEAPLADLFAAATRVREHHMGNKVDFCAIASVKTGSCPEDCSYCAQSIRSNAEIETTGLLDKAEVLERAKNATRSGARRFCLVTSGRAARGVELKQLAGYVTALRTGGLLPCATLGLLGKEDLRMLKAAGLERYHHNLETSRRFFPEICSSHTYDQKLETIRVALEAGLSVCSGGIFGLGETWQDRINMAMDISDLGVDSVPINFLVPVHGTPLGKREALHPFEALRIISLYRLMLPAKQIRVCGGRLQTLGEFNSMVFLAGADGLLTGDCLTVAGCSPEADVRLAEAYGLSL